MISAVASTPAKTPAGWPDNSTRPTVSAAALGFFDVAMGALIITAGSQGIYRFVPTLAVWLLIYAFVASRFLFNFQDMIDILRKNMAILAFPLAALISAIWSVSPGTSGYSAFQLTVTYLAGFWIGWRFRPRDITFLIALALTPLIMLSLVNAFTGMFGDVYASAGGLLGIFGNKNTLGRMALLLAMACIGLLYIGPQKRVSVVLLLVTLSAAMYAILISKSATSALFLIGCIGVFAVLSLRNLGMAFRVFLTSVFTIGLLGVAGFVVVSGIDPIDSVLDLFGKSSSLTGRTLLWDVAIDEIGTRPWLGVGFNSYWSSDVFTGADRIQLIFGDGVISFHNFILDVWVATGLPGLVGLGITLGSVLLVFARYYSGIANIESALMISIFIVAIGVANFNPLLHGQHGNMIVILIAYAVSANLEMQFGSSHVRAQRIRGGA